MIDGEKIGADISGKWVHALDREFVNKVHLAMASPKVDDGAYFVHKEKQYFRATDGHVYRRVQDRYGRPT